MLYLNKFVGDTYQRNNKKEIIEMDTIKLDSGKVKMIAHRGLSGLEKENTNAAFVAAGNRAKYFGIETDLHVTADKGIIVIHDDNTSRVSTDDLNVESSSYETLRKIRLLDIDGSRGRSDLLLPSLEEYVGICKKYEKYCILELKNPMDPEDVYGIVETIKAMGYLEHVVFISFALSNLVALRERYPQQSAMYLIGKEWKDEVYGDLEKYNLDLDIDYRILTKDIVDRVHAMGHTVNVWTVNDEESGLRMVEMGVDYITTNILE